MRHFVVTGNTLLWLYTVINCNVYDVRQCRLLVVNKILEKPRFSVELEAAGSAGLLEATFQQPSSNIPIYKASLTLSRIFLLFTKYVKSFSFAGDLYVGLIKRKISNCKASICTCNTGCLKCVFCIIEQTAW